MKTGFQASKMRIGLVLILAIIHPPFAYSSSLQQTLPAFVKPDHNPNNELSSKMRHEVRLHGVLLWASLGFLMPIGILVIRMSNREENATRLKLYFYLHLILQMLSLSLATTGAIMSMKAFNNSFSNNHQRIGLALYAAIWVQAIIGFCRPHRGSKKRRAWYFLHWIFGTVICTMGIMNIYTGLEAYKKRTKRSVSLLMVLFTAQISSMAFLYLFQDKWHYIKRQGVCLGEAGQVRPHHQEISDREPNGKDLWREPCSKVNALKNLFN